MQLPLNFEAIAQSLCFNLFKKTEPDLAAREVEAFIADPYSFSPLVSAEKTDQITLNHSALSVHVDPTQKLQVKQKD